MTKPSPNDAILYARFSPRPRKRRGLAVGIPAAERIELQLEAARRYCQWAGLNPRWEISEQYTSAYELSLSERPRGPEVLELLHAGARHIVTAKVDRLFRSLKDGLTWLEDFDKRRITWHIADQRGLSLRTDNADGFMYAVMQLLSPQIEAMRTRERTSSTMRSHQRNGRNMSSRAPYGWSIDGEALIPNTTEQAIRAEIIRLSESMAPWSIATTLNKRGLAKRSGSPWDATQVRRILDHAKEKENA